MSDPFFYLIFIYIRISHTVILDDPFNDPAALRVPSQSPEPPKDMTDVCLLYLKTESYN